MPSADIWETLHSVVTLWLTADGAISVSYRFSDETYDNHPMWISMLVVVVLVSPLYLLTVSMPTEMAI